MSPGVGLKVSVDPLLAQGLPMTNHCAGEASEPLGARPAGCFGRNNVDSRTDGGNAGSHCVPATAMGERVDSAEGPL